MKVIIPFDGARFSEAAFSFAISINQVKPVLLTGIFLSQADFSRFFLLPPAVKDASVLLEKSIDEENIRKNIVRFTSLCKENDIQYSIHEDLYDFALPELTKESRFADLLIIGSEMFLKDISQHDYNMFLQDTLKHTECPVMVVPEKFYSPLQNILAYDASASSAFAIKQFAYLFPHLCDNKTILVYAAQETQDIPGQVNIEELVTSHFSNLAITVLNADDSPNLTEWVLKHENSLMISGSFGRSGFSSQFAKSFIIDIIDAHSMPVFIAHQ